MTHSGTDRGHWHAQPEGDALHDAEKGDEERDVKDGAAEFEEELLREQEQADRHVE